MSTIRNERLAAIRKAVIITGKPKFTRRAYAVACLQDNELIHVESFFGQDGRVMIGQARRYLKRYLAGESLGLESRAYRMSMTTTFDTAASRAAINAVKES